MIEPSTKLDSNRPALRLGGTPVDPSPNRTPQVLHVRVISDHGGGPDKTIFRSARYGGSGGVHIAAAYIHPRGDSSIDSLRESAVRRDCPLWSIAETGPADPRTPQALLRLCRQLNVSIWHGHDYKSNLLGLMLRARWPMNLVTTVHGWTWHTARTRLYYHVDNWCLRRYDRVIAVNPKLVTHCVAHGVAPNRLAHIPNAIELTEYPRLGDRETARRDLEIDRDRLVIGVVGRLSPEKGVDRAMRTLARLHRTWPHVQLHVIGDGPERARLTALAQQLEVADAVRFWGWQVDTQRFYPAMDMLLIPSHTEGLPNAALEAMTMGVPVAATQVGGIGELLDHGRCGVLLSQDDQTWVNRLAYLLASTQRRETIAHLARGRIEQQYTFDRRMERVLGLYQELLAVHSGSNKSAPVPRRRAA